MAIAWRRPIFSLSSTRSTSRWARSGSARKAGRARTTGCVRSCPRSAKTSRACASASRPPTRSARSVTSSHTCSHRSMRTSAPRRRRRSRAPRKRRSSPFARASSRRWRSSMVSAVDVAPARLGGVLAVAERSEAYRELASRLDDRRRITVADANAGARAFAWSALVAQNARYVAIVAPSEDRARRWRAELAGWLGEDRVLAFPERETMPFEVGSASAGAVHQRLLTLWRAHTAPEPVAVVASLRALMQHTIAPRDLRERGRTLRAGDHVSWNATAEWLFELGYEPVAEVS